MCRRLFCNLLVSLALAAVQLGCQSTATDSKDKQYDVTAKVTAVDSRKMTVTLDHEAIPGFMQAMEMEFAIENSQLLDGIQVGDLVRGKLSAKSGENVITRLEKR